MPDGYVSVPTYTNDVDPRPPVTHPAWYGAPISEFLATRDEHVLGFLATASAFTVELDQRDAWRAEIAILRASLTRLDGWVYLEFDIPRLGSRIDAVVVAGAAVVPIEFKVGEREFRRADREQVWDYALDLKNFHAASHEASLFPLLVATEADTSSTGWGPPHADGVRPPCCADTNSLADFLLRARSEASGPKIDGREWGVAPYRPTPTIVQAARALYRRHSVEAISRNDAGAKNLAVTSARVDEIVDEARTRGSKEIVFVTGVPGAGKTLLGLNVATRRRDIHAPTHAVFLSGNTPLVAVLSEALIRDEQERIEQERGARLRKGEVAQKVKSFIQNVHHFRDEGLRDPSRPPVDRVVIFDEAQRAWNLDKTADFMKRRKKRPGFTQSEPEFLLSYMDRHPDWAVVICLVGGGQEIHTGEAGIGAWLDAVRTRFPLWRIHVSPTLTDSEYEALDAIRALEGAGPVQCESDLHLSVSLRSFRAGSLSAFVKAALDGEVETARSLSAALRERYPMVVTRDLFAAKRWVREHARGSERYGLVASSKAERLKPYAVDVRVDVDPVHWFLDDAEDTRSSYFLEDAATEFQIQGLELDWTCVTWDADLRRTADAWTHHGFRGDRWINLRKPERLRYLLNAYRVLLTRARQGMAIFVPPGDADDRTRDPAFYDSTYRYLADLGLPTLSV
jgi:hypothetical protein